MPLDLFPPHEAAIFDLDGTLLDSMWVWHAVDRDFFAARGIAIPGDYIKAIHAMTFRETAEYTVERFHLPESVESVMATWYEMSFRQYRDNVRLKPGAKQYLEHLSAKRVKLGVATALSRPVIDAVLASNGVLHLFDTLTSSDESPRSKCHPDIYLLTADRLGVEPRKCVAFDDVAPALAAIRAAGMTACAVREPGFGQDWDDLVRLSDVQIIGFEDML